MAVASEFPADSDASSGRKSSFVQAVINVMNILMGVGLLSIPYALKQAGWLGLVVLGVLGFVTNYSGGPAQKLLPSPVSSNLTLTYLLSPLQPPLSEYG